MHPNPHAKHYIHISKLPSFMTFTPLKQYIRVAEFAKALESGHIAGGEQRGSQVLLEHTATQTTDSVDELLKTYLQVRIMQQRLMNHHLYS